MARVVPDWNRPSVDRGLTELVRFTGAVPSAVAELLAASDVFRASVLLRGDPDLDHGSHGLWLAGRGDRGQGHSELVRPYETGVLVPPARADALVVALRELLTDPDRRTRWVAEARRLVESAHDERKTIPELAELLGAPSPACADRNGPMGPVLGRAT
ncbi:MAG: glycosyltransferase [Ilumatobacteraceae bacterium]